ncbi:MAG: tripartite tricarboxylate transporter TctB family protein [Rhizomicrobium sp.]
MNDTGQSAAGPSHCWTEVAVAAFMALLGLVTILGSVRVGISWGAEGPQSGFFPFYVGLVIIGTSAVNLARAYMDKSRGLFAEWSQLRQVVAVVVPTAVYVFAIPYAGIYLASAILIAFFMLWLGKYRLPITAAVAIGVPLALFLMFEKWFLVPLPKGPIEILLGF